MPLCKINLLPEQWLPASKHQFLDDTKIKISSKNWCWLAGIWLHVSQMIRQSGIYYYFLWYILIFWAQKCWFIELNLTFGSDVVCLLYSICITFLSFPAPAVNCIYQYETYILPILLDPPKRMYFEPWRICILCM